MSQTAAAAATARSSPVATLSPGMLVRVARLESPGRRGQGTIARITGAALVLRTDAVAGTVAFPFSRLASFELPAGNDRRRRVRRGATVGAGVGLVLTAVDASSPGIGVAVSRALLGWLIGSGFRCAFPPSGWVPFPLPARLSMSFFPQPERIGGGGIRPRKAYIGGLSC